MAEIKNKIAAVINDEKFIVSDNRQQEKLCDLAPLREKLKLSTEY